MAIRTCPKCQGTYADDMDYCPRDATALASAASATQAELESTLARRFRIVRRLGAGGVATVRKIWKKILGDNVLRVMRQVENVAMKMQAEGGK